MRRVYDGDAEKAIRNAYKEEAVKYIIRLYRETFVSRHSSTRKFSLTGFRGF
jgi:hypothetical protein